MGPLFLVLAFGGMYLLMIRPQQQRLRAQRELVASLKVGDRVVTAGGAIGTITWLDDRDAGLEVAPGVVVAFLRPAVSRRLDDDADELEAEPVADSQDTEEGLE
jgi:preprotein translocase subunit YajC